MAVDPVDGVTKQWGGPAVPGNTLEEARNYCREKLGFCEVDGYCLVSEIPEHNMTPVWAGRIDYQNKIKE